jgi:hypothetical protein
MAGFGGESIHLAGAFSRPLVGKERRIMPHENFFPFICVMILDSTNPVRNEALLVRSKETIALLDEIIPFKISIKTG